MRSKTFLFFLLTLFTFLKTSATEIKISKCSFVEIVTPNKIVYDDGIYRTVFSSFSLYNESGEKIISCGDVYDFAAIVKLPYGTYKISSYNKNGELIEKQFTIENEKIIRVVITN